MIRLFALFLTLNFLNLPLFASDISAEIAIKPSISASLDPSFEQDLQKLFDHDSYPTTHYKKRAEKYLAIIENEGIRKLAIATSRLVFSGKYEVHYRLEFLEHLVNEKLVGSLSEVQEIFSYLENKKSSYQDLYFLDRAPKAKFLISQHKHHNKIMLLLEEANQYLNINADNPINQSASEVIECLEHGLQLRQDNGSSAPLLSCRMAERTLDIFLRFAQIVCKNANGMKSSGHHPTWGWLAKTYLKIALNAFTDEKQYAETDEYFVKELLDRIKEKTTSYEWFTLFTDRLTILITTPDKREIVPGFNTKLDAYKVSLVKVQHAQKPAWYTDDGYRKACQTVGPQITRDALSPLGLCRQHFPNIVMMPYPFELSDKDILLTMPRPQGSHLWTLGFALSKAVADGGNHPPSIFYTHDQAHLATFTWYLATSNDEGRELGWTALKLLQDIASQPECEEQDRMNIFFGFLAVHEKRSSLVTRLNSLISCEIDCTLSDTAFRVLTDMNHYLSLLSPSLKAKAKNRADFEKMYYDYERQFIKDFAKKDHNGTLVQAIRNFVETERLKGKAPSTIFSYYLE